MLVVELCVIGHLDDLQAMEKVQYINCVFYNMCNMLIVYSAGQIDCAIQYYKVRSMPTLYFL